MSIDSEHEEYALRKKQWGKIRDCVAGQEAVHDKQTEYLPKLSGQDNDEYKAYLKRATFYGATARTVDGLSGMIFRKDPMIEAPDGMTDFLEDVSLDGTSLLGFAEKIVEDDLVTARCGILVDHPTQQENATIAQAEANNIRPFMKHYEAESIFNWKTESRNNKQVLTQVRLWEFQEYEDPEEEFETKVRKQIRILDFNEQGQYRQRVFIEKETSDRNKKEWIQDGDDIIPLMRGIALDVIPFYFVGVKGGSATTEKPPLIDLANVNLSHYMTTADLEHGAHFTGLPTAVVSGFQETEDDDGEFKIGAANAWVFPNPEASAYYLEFEGKGLDSLEKRLEHKEQQMAALGARMLAPEKRAAETAETAQIHRIGENSVLSSLAKSAAESIEKALKFMAEWAGFTGDVSFKLNNDFIAVPMTPQQLTALLGVWQGGGMAFDDFIYNLKRGEIIKEERTTDEIQSDIETENPFSGEDVGSIVDVTV